MIFNKASLTFYDYIVQRFHLSFVRAGARFDVDSQKRYCEIMEHLAELTTQFTQNILKDEETIYVELEGTDVIGLPDFLVNSAKKAAEDRHLSAGKYAIPLSRSHVVPFLTFSSRRDLRETVWRKWTQRGMLHEERDNSGIVVEILKLRFEQAKMHGYNCYADFALEDTMAKQPEVVLKLLNRVWSPAKLAADRERVFLEHYVKECGEVISDIEPWDWRFYAEKVRKSKFDLDEAEVKPYFSLDNMVNAIFDCANKLFGLSFILRRDIVAYHPDVKVYEVREKTTEGADQVVAIFLHDNFSRNYKLSGIFSDILSLSG